MMTKRDLHLERRATRGYTAVEVGLSIIVLGIGAAGAMTMQAAAVQGNSDAHMMDLGNSIAREWVDRLRRDSMTWTITVNAATSTVTTNWSTNTFLVSQIGGVAAGTWVWPKPPSKGLNNETASPWGYGRAFDILGRDVLLTGAAQPGVMFCANVKGDWILTDTAIRATVRVYWPRQMFKAPAATFCSDGEIASNSTTATESYHFIYAVTALQGTAQE